MSASLIRIICVMTLLAAFPTRAEQNDGLQLQSVVIVSRHGVRAPTKLTPLMQNVTPDTAAMVCSAGLVNTAWGRTHFVAGRLSTPTVNFRRPDKRSTVPVCKAGCRDCRH